MGELHYHEFGNAVDILHSYIHTYKAYLRVPPTANLEAAATFYRLVAGEIGDDGHDVAGIQQR